MLFENISQRKRKTPRVTVRGMKSSRVELNFLLKTIKVQATLPPFQQRES